jgi:cbb3-type cytochrome oxidase maturation protein
MTNVIFSLELSHSFVIHTKIVLIGNYSLSMSVIILLLLASISVAAMFLGAFIWSVKTGQYDDEASAPMRMLFDDATIQSTNILEEID